MGITPYARDSSPRLNSELPETAVSGANISRSPCRQERHGVTQRTRCSQRQIIRDADAILTCRGRAAWAHDFNPTATSPPAFQTLPAPASWSTVPPRPADAALATASAEAKWRNGFSLAATFEGEFSNVTKSTPARASRATHGNRQSSFAPAGIAIAQA